VTQPTRNPLIIGAGAAGLTAALKLVERGVRPRIYEESEHVGGLARTVSHGDWRVDPGGHRFFTKNEEIMDLWRSLLPADQWISVQRKSAMLVDGHLFTYPLVGRDLVMQLGARRGLRGLTSFLWSRFLAGMRDGNGPGNFREWGEREFGPYWYKMFFEGYVRKTWLADPNHIPSDWANQRIKPINWRFRKEPDPADQDAFLYPRLGPGQLWEAAAGQLVASGVELRLNTRVVEAGFDGSRWTLGLDNGAVVTGDAVFSTMPLPLLVNALRPRVARHVRQLAATLRHRSLITVSVALRRHLDIPLNWIYTPSQELQVGRIQNYGRWSRHLVPGNWKGTYLGFEYYVEPGGELWAASDDRMRSVVEEDLRKLGVGGSDVERVMVERTQFAYPIYDHARDRNVELVRRYLTSHYPSLHPMGRNGMHHYDNQDHAMLSAMQSVALYFGASVNPWQVNTEICYHESGLLQQ
jgi:protoporphyrinogen oxidase